MTEGRMSCFYGTWKDFSDDTEVKGKFNNLSNKIYVITKLWMTRINLHLPDILYLIYPDPVFICAHLPLSALTSAQRISTNESHSPCTALSITKGQYQHILCCSLMWFHHSSYSVLESSTVPYGPLCGLCQSVCAPLTLPRSIVLESRVVSGLEAAVLVWI